jgi:hypothetical protein
MRVPRRPGTRRFATVLGLVLLIGAALPSAVAAATVADLVARATNANTWAMSCSASADQVLCSKIPRIGPRWSMTIKPAKGPIDAVNTGSMTTLPMDGASANWMTDMHQFACGSPKAIDAFVNQVGALQKNAEIGPVIIGTCQVVGGLYGGATAPQQYRVISLQLPPPTPAPTATPGPTGTPAPTAPPTHTPAPSTSPTATPVATAGASAAPSALASASASASTVPSESPGASASTGPSPVVGGVQTGPPSPGPTSVVAGPAEATPVPTPGPTAPTFEQSVAGITDVNTDTGAIGGSLLLALLLLLIVGFAGELFNNTVENNYSIIAGWLKKGPLGFLRSAGGRFFGEARIGLVAFLLLTALVSCFVDPHFGFDLRSLGEFLGFLVGLVIVLATFKLPPMLAHRRNTGDLGRLRPLPWALVIAAVFVLVSRIGNLQPGYLYGIVLGAIFVKEVSPKEEGRETFFGSVWTLLAAGLGWLGLTWLHGLGVDPSGFAITLLATACAVVTVAGLEATAFGLMPLRFMPGYAVYRWSRVAWATLWGLSLFGFLHILIAPTSGYVSQLSPQAFAAALGIFAAFGALSILTWGYFRFRRPTAALEVRFD